MTLPPVRLREPPFLAACIKIESDYQQTCLIWLEACPALIASVTNKDLLGVIIDWTSDTNLKKARCVIQCGCKNYNDVPSWYFYNIWIISSSNQDNTWMIPESKTIFPGTFCQWMLCCMNVTSKESENLYNIPPLSDHLTYIYTYQDKNILPLFYLFIKRNQVSSSSACSTAT